jgi:AcrR family transcriptional regulator
MAERDKKTQRTRAAIEMALVRLLATKAYDAITMADIAQEADVAVRTVQRHFGSKDDILAAAVRYPGQALSEELSKRPPGQSPHEDLHSLAASLFTIYARYRREMWAAYTRSADVPELIQALLVGTSAILFAVDALLARWSDRRVINPLLAKRAIVALVSYPTWRGLAGAGGFGAPEAATVIARLLHHLIFEASETP